jgi:hypothetical protein
MAAVKDSTAYGAWHVQKVAPQAHDTAAGQIVRSRHGTSHTAANKRNPPPSGRKGPTRSTATLNPHNPPLAWVATGVKANHERHTAPDAPRPLTEIDHVSEAH